MTRKRALTAVLFPLVLSSSSALGQVLPFFTNTAQTVGFESNAFRTFSRVLVRNQLQIEGQEVPDPEDRRVLVFAQVFAVPLRITSDTVITLAAPIFHKELAFNDSAAARRELSGRGFGDLTFSVKRRFYQNDFLGGGVQAAFLGGLKLPTGDSDQLDDQGNLLPRSLQLGSGSLDVPIGLTFTAFKGRVGFTSDFLYQFNNESDGFRFGDQTKVNLAVGYRVSPREYSSFQDKVLNAYLELNTSVAKQAVLNGQDLLNTGGTTVFLTPGIQWVLSPRFLVEAAFQIPVVQDLNGSQLAFAPTANAGIRILF